jgi:hypothetical protein
VSPAAGAAAGRRTGVAPAPPGDRVIERELRIIVYADSGDPDAHVLRARWRADSDRRTHAELRVPPRPGGPAEPGGAGVIGRITVTWQGISDGFLKPFLGVLSGSLGIGNADPATEMGEIEIEIDESVAGRPLTLRTRRAGNKPLHWEVRGSPADWWSRVVVFRDGAPTPREFGDV